MKVIAGCSGFHYKDWKGKFYPEGLPEKEFLKYYAGKFDTVEINNTFYKVPEKKTLKNWVDQTPDDFTFSLKGSRYITHMKKLKDPKEPLNRFYDSVEPILEKTKCILWQLPGNQHKDMEKLAAFIEQLTRDTCHVFEFRHASWYDEEVQELLKENNMVFCSVSSPLEELPDDIMVSAGKAYIRMHGIKEWYDYHYSEKELKSMADDIQRSGAGEVLIYFNNDVAARAPKNALELLEMIDS